jgi:hypothetical protein
VGYKVPLTNEIDFVERMEKILVELSENRDHLLQLRRQGMTYIRESLTWEAKAEATTKILRWAVKQGPKPDFPPPKMLEASLGSTQQNAVPYARA